MRAHPNPTGFPPCDTPRMHMDDRFFEQAFRTVGDGLLRVVARANLHLKPETLTKSLKRRCLADLRQLSVILRRLIFLMALAIELAPARPRAAKPAARPDGVEDVTASFGPQTGLFGLAPRLSGPLPDCFRTCSGLRPGGPVAAAPLIARWIALHRVLQDPAAHARRLARTIRRWKARGETKPVVAPMAGRHRLHPELALIAGLLPGLLARALAGWYDTG